MPTYLTSDGLNALSQYESGGNPIAQNPASTASGLYGFLGSTWRAYAPSAGVNTSVYPTAASAPPALQTAVAGITPTSNWTCAGCDPKFTSQLASNPQWLNSTPGTAIDTANRSSGTYLELDPNAAGSGSTGTGALIDATGASSGLYTEPGVGGTTAMQLRADTAATNAQGAKTSFSLFSSLGDWFQRGSIIVLAILAIVAAMIWLALETDTGKKIASAVIP